MSKQYKYSSNYRRSSSKTILNTNMSNKKDNIININNRYNVYGTEAVNYDYYTTAVPKDNKTHERKRRQGNSREKQRELVRENIKFVASMSIVGIILFISCLKFVSVTSIINQKEMELKRINKELRDVKSEINYITQIIEENTKLEDIQYRASIMLDMAEPLPHQIIYIDMPKESYTEYADTSNVNTKTRGR